MWLNKTIVGHSNKVSQPLLPVIYMRLNRTIVGHLNKVSQILL